VAVLVGCGEEDFSVPGDAFDVIDIAGDEASEYVVGSSMGLMPMAEALVRGLSSQGPGTLAMKARRSS
jgi:hypothetical protein